MALKNHFIFIFLLCHLKIFIKIIWHWKGSRLFNISISAFFSAFRSALEIAACRVVRAVSEHPPWWRGLAVRGTLRPHLPIGKPTIKSKSFVGGDLSSTGTPQAPCSPVHLPGVSKKVHYLQVGLFQDYIWPFSSFHVSGGKLFSELVLTLWSPWTYIYFHWPVVFFTDYL